MPVYPREIMRSNGSTYEVWIADFNDRLGNRHRPSFRSKGDATRHLRTQEAAVERGDFRIDAARKTVGDLARDYLATASERHKAGDLERGSYELYCGNVDHYLLASRPTCPDRNRPKDLKFFPHAPTLVKLSDFGPESVLEFRRHLRLFGLKSTTVKNITTRLSLVMQHGTLFRKWISSNPVPIALSLERSTNRERPLEVQIPDRRSISHFIRSAKDGVGLEVAFAASTGLRASEQWELRWKDIDLQNKTVTVSRRVDRYKAVGLPKTSASYRTLPLSSDLVDRLVRFKRESRSAGWEDLIFPNTLLRNRDHPAHARKFKKEWKRLISSWKGDAPLRACTWHQLRHFAISVWLAERIPIKRVSRWAGHSSVEVTLKTYGHLLDGDDYADEIEAASGKLLAA